MQASLSSSSHDLAMANCVVFAGECSEHMKPADATIANNVLMDLMRAPVAAQQTAMESAIAQAAESIDLGSLNISGAIDPTDVRLEVAGNNTDKGHNGIA